MKLLIYDWNSITKYDLYNEIKKQGIEYELFHSKYSPRVACEQESFRNDIEETLKNKKYDAIFSINFVSMLAEAANKKDMLYISWSYDSPSLNGTVEVLKYDTNHIFLFDTSEYEEYKEYDIKNLYYLPLAVNAERLGNMMPYPLTKMRYYADVSFVGQLYQSDMDKIFPLFDEYSAGYIAALINTQMNVHGINFIRELITDKMIERLCNKDVSKALVDNLNNGFFHDIENLETKGFNGFLLKAVTNKERVLILSLLAKYFRVNLFTKDVPNISNVKLCGIVDYNFDMPLVFKCSKINLNMTLRNIRHGIPQRVLDIMGSGGVALTNYQKDMDEYFKDHDNVLIYHCAEEALDKCKFYLKNTSLAEKIRDKGYETVKKNFSYEERLNYIWKTCGLKND